MRSLVDIVNELRAYDTEREWFEFKENWFEAKTIPTAYAEERFIRIGSSKEKLRKYPEKESFLFAILRDGFPTIENTESEYQDLRYLINGF